MSNLSDLLKALTDDNAAASDAAGAFIGLVADVSGFASGVSSLVEFLQFFPNLQSANQDVLNALANLQTVVTNGIKQIETQVAFQSLLDKMGRVDTVMDAANGVFASLRDELPKLPNDVIVQNLLTPCLTALNALSDDDAKWTVPWAPSVAYTDDWSGNLWPPEDGLVFSYVYTLPKFLHAIAIFLAVAAGVRQFQPDVLANHLNDLGRCVDRLQQVLDKIAASTGLVGTKMPQESDVASIAVSGEAYEWDAKWFYSSGSGVSPLVPGDPRLWPFGAVETYSGVSKIDSYWPFLPFEISPYTIPDKFFKLLALRIENHKKQLFSELGFPAARRAIITLQGITGQPTSTARPYEAWSLRDALKLLGLSLSGSGAFQSMFTFLRATPPYSGGYLFPLQSGHRFPPSPLPKSFRSVFMPP